MSQNNVINSWKSVSSSDYSSLNNTDKQKNSSVSQSFGLLLTSKLQASNSVNDTAKSSIGLGSSQKTQRFERPKVKESVKNDTKQNVSDSSKKAVKENETDDEVTLKDKQKVTKSDKTADQDETAKVDESAVESMDKSDATESIDEVLKNVNELLSQMIQVPIESQSSEGIAKEANLQSADLANVMDAVKDIQLKMLEISQNGEDINQLTQLTDQLSQLKTTLTALTASNQNTDSLESLKSNMDTKSLDNAVSELGDLISKLTAKNNKTSEKTTSFEKKLQEIIAGANTESSQTEVSKSSTNESMSQVKENPGDVKSKMVAESNSSKDNGKTAEIFDKIVSTKTASEPKASTQLNVQEAVAKMDASTIAFSKNDVNVMGKTTLQQNILDQIINSPRLQVKQTEQGTMMTLKLNPEVLGNVEIKMEIVKNVFKAEIQVENMIVKGAIESNLADLKQALSEKGYQVDVVEVSVNDQNANQQQQQQRQSKDEERQFNFMSKVDSDNESETSSTYSSEVSSDGNFDYLG